MAKAKDVDWKLRAETAEALLEAEREEIEHLRAYIKELENKLPDEEGGEELPEPEPETEKPGKLAGMLKWLIDDDVGWEKEQRRKADEVMQQMLARLVDPADLVNPFRPERLLIRPQARAEVAAERNQENGSARIVLRMSDGRVFNYAIGYAELCELRSDPRRAGGLIHRIVQGFMGGVGSRDPIHPEILRGSVGKVLMNLIEGKDQY